MQYDVKFVKDGRGGWAYYREGGETLRFEWDGTTHGFEIFAPRPDEWDGFCTERNAMQFVGRRQEILERVGEEVRRTKARKAKVTIDDMGIDFSFEGDWLHSLLSRILGV